MTVWDFAARLAKRSCILAAHRPGAIMDKSGRRFVGWFPTKHPHTKTDTNIPSVTPSKRFLQNLSDTTHLL